ncbi:choice-of-anchor I family protein [Marinobacter mangrovi]|uniref:choice-of-anchor I family protein n=1 Tax=Marinobacter mangrovi TaxID=2803918 RepID=UPI0019340D5F|nr:choice-of-anchor I family protein [Marinobacter mangrovi]
MTNEWQTQKRLLACAVLAATLGLTACNNDDNNDNGDDADTRVSIALEQTGRYTSDDNGFDEGAAEILTYDKDSTTLFITNADAKRVDVVDVQDPTNPQLIDQIDASANWADAGDINSVTFANGLIAVAVEHDTKTEHGRVQIYNSADRNFRGQVEVGSLPDMVTFNRDGTKVLVANEGEPNDDYSVDPEGSVSIVDVTDPDNPTAQTVGFTDFNVGNSRADELPEGVRIFGNYGRTALTVDGFADTDPATLTVNEDISGVSVNDWLTLASTEGDPLPYQVAAVDAANKILTLTTDFDGDSEVTAATAAGLTVYLHDGQSSVAQDLEPEYIALSTDGGQAWVTLQENNAFAVIDIANASVDRIVALGTKDFNADGVGLDPSDKDDGINIAQWPVKGLYMPDTIASIQIGGKDYYFTANEGDSREYDGFVEEIRFEDAPREGDLATADFGDKTTVGRLATSLTSDTDGNGILDTAEIYGARSFSIWDSEGALVSDSGSDFETITAEQLGEDFNSDNDENDSGDSRSDAKGPEPEAMAVGRIGEQTFAFIGLERVGGIMVYDVSNPEAPEFVQYLNNRDFSYPIKDNIDDGDQPAYAAGDLAPECIDFISGDDSPTGEPMLAVGNEVSGSTTLYTIKVTEEDVE